MRFQTQLERRPDGRIVPKKNALAYQVFYLMNAVAIKKIINGKGLEGGVCYDVVGLPCNALCHIWRIGDSVNVGVTKAGQFRDSIMKGMRFVLADSFGVSPDCIECHVTGLETCEFNLYSQMCIVFDG